MENIKEFFENADALSSDRVITKEELLTLHDKLNNGVEGSDESEISEIYSETKKEIREFFNDVLSDMLREGYLIESKEDYENLLKMLESSDLGFSLTTFNKLRDGIKGSVNRDTPYRDNSLGFIVYINSNGEQTEKFISSISEGLGEQKVDRTFFSDNFDTKVTLLQLQNDLTRLNEENIILQQRIDSIPDTTNHIYTLYYNLGDQISSLNIRLISLESEGKVEGNVLHEVQSKINDLREDLTTLLKNIEEEERNEDGAPMILGDSPEFTSDTNEGVDEEPNIPDDNETNETLFSQNFEYRGYNFEAKNEREAEVLGLLEQNPIIEGNDQESLLKSQQRSTKLMDYGFSNISLKDGALKITFKGEKFEFNVKGQDNTSTNQREELNEELLHSTGDEPLLDTNQREESNTSEEDGTNQELVENNSKNYPLRDPDDRPILNEEEHIRQGEEELIEDTNQRVDEEPDTSEEDGTKKESVEIKEETIYEVKSGDNLWNIVKNHYGLTNNSEIINKVNKISELQTDSRLRERLIGSVVNGIMGNRLWVGDKIKLPSINEL